MTERASIAAVVLLALASCATPPAVLRGDFYSPISPSEAVLEHRTGAYVRWGGRIVSLAHEEKRTCFDILGQPLDARARPEDTDAAEGRFRACAPGFYDPQVYREGRSVTVVGVIEQETTRSFESFDLQMPLVAADVVYLWPERVYYAYPPYPYPAYPYGWGWPYYTYGWGPYPYFGWGPYGGPWFGAAWAGPYYGYRGPRGYPHGGGDWHGRGPAPAGGRPIRGGGVPGGGGGGGGMRAPVRGR